ncbi:MBL fold metallo-hydrolase [Paraflavisolibacter sp. H34]|uniref:MBL fold metallo-hydrolase n=1 Tax=Huijunlia imazamoxiresistens TaxID=3127457 RepID=UPI0030195CE0
MSCPPLKITFLGTGTSSGVPMIACGCPVCTSEDKRDNRLRSSILIESPTTTVVVDTTPDFRYQMLRARVKKLDAVLFTHSHKDHIAGLDDIRAFNYLQQQPMVVYANQSTMKELKREFEYAFAENKYPGVPDIELVTITTEPFRIGDIPVTPIMVWHLKMKVYGFRFGKFTYITDANRIDESEKQKAVGSDTIVLNALRHQPHISHFSLSEAVGLVQELQVPHAYFTHISHQLGRHADVDPGLPGGMHLAYDGLVLQFD